MCILMASAHGTAAILVSRAEKAVVQGVRRKLMLPSPALQLIEHCLLLTPETHSMFDGWLPLT